VGQSRDYLHFIQIQLELGLEAYVQLPPRQHGLITDSYHLHGLPVSYHPSVQVREWTEIQPGEKWPLLFKEYHTPAGPSDR
jgi:hypothetical protein